MQRPILLLFMWIEISLSQSQMTPVDPSTFRNAQSVVPSLSSFFVSLGSSICLYDIRSSHSDPAHGTLLSWAASYFVMVLATGQMCWLSSGCLCCDDPVTQGPQCWVYDFCMAKCIPPCPPYLITIHQLPKLKTQESPIHPLLSYLINHYLVVILLLKKIFGLFPLYC